MMMLSVPGQFRNLIAFTLLGAAICAGHLSLLAWNTRVLLRADGMALVIALPLLRIALAAGGFLLAIQYGGGALLACIAGFLGALAAILNVMRIRS